MELAGRRVVVMGLGRSGRAAARLAVERGADVVGVDLRTEVDPIEGARLELGPHRRDTFTHADLLIVSPGIAAAQPDVVAAIDAGVDVVGELAFADRLLDVPVIGITGTNGKSTVTHFTGAILEAAGLRVFAGGNLGRPLTDAVGGDWDALVVEISSYQLELPGELKPRVGCILNLTPDHLARHKTMAGYAAAKARLFERCGPSDVAAIPHDPLLEAACAGQSARRVWLGDTPGVVRDGLHARVQLDVAVDLDLSGLDVPGEHNKDNAATAALLALAFGVEPGAVQAAIPGLDALQHRMQVVADRGGVLWINDSKATNVDAARVGVSGLDRPAVVLLGGQAKGDGFADLVPWLKRHRAVIAFGGSGPAIADELADAGLAVERVDTMEQAMARAAELARPGDAVLLSPGCASFDAYDDFEHRGRVFTALAQGGT